MKKKIFALFLVIILVFSSLSVTATEESDISRVYKKVIRQPLFNELYEEAAKNFDSYGVTDEYITEKLRAFIGSMLSDAHTERNNDNITKDNIKEIAFEIVFRNALAIDDKVFSILLGVLSDEEMNMLFKGELPGRFYPVAEAVYQELGYILDFDIRDPDDMFFDDMAGYEWSNAAVEDLFDKGIVNGMSEFLFAPYEKVTREQFVKMLLGAFNIEIIDDGSCSFSDVDKNAWYYPYITTMTSLGLVNGIGDNRFGVGLNITRQDMAVLIFRIGENKGVLASAPKKSPFNDEEKISYYALNSVYSLKGYGIMNGDNNGNCNPLSDATRAEAAQMIFNMLQKIKG